MVRTSASPPVHLGVITELLSLTHRAVRFYEEKGLLDLPRDRLNRRLIDSQSRRRLERIALFRCARLGLEDIREVLDLEPENPRSFAATTAKLEAREAELAAQLRVVREVRHVVERQGPPVLPAATQTAA